jgi:hypothetical protein
VPETIGYTREEYDAEREKYELRALVAAAGVSEQAGGIKTSTRNIRATQLFTRLNLAGFTFLRMLPGNTITGHLGEFWDWPSIACIARNIVETFHLFWYLSDPSLSAEEVDMRVSLMHLHLNTEKYKLYKEWNAGQEVLRSFEEGLPRDRARLEANRVFASLPERQRKELLKGNRPMHLTHSEIGGSLPFMDRHFRPIYRLFSNHVHSTPLSFQAQSNTRGRGDENDAERFYIILAIQVVIKYLTAAVIEMARMFPREVGAPCSRLVDIARELHAE